MDFRQIIDVSVTIRPDLAVWPGDPSLEIEQASKISEGADANVSRLNMGAHTGTHMDAPVHFIEGTGGIDSFSPETLVGTAYVVEILPQGDHIEAADLEKAGLPENFRRVLFKTRNSSFWEQPDVFRKDYIALSPGGAKWLVERGVKLVGIDYLSIERFQPEKYETHQMLLSHGVVIVEGLDLRQVEPGEYTLMALPLKIKDGDGAPARVLLAR
jgi:arylformamidase